LDPAQRKSPEDKPRQPEQAGLKVISSFHEKSLYFEAEHVLIIRAYREIMSVDRRSRPNTTAEFYRLYHFTIIFIDHIEFLVKPAENDLRFRLRGGSYYRSSGQTFQRSDPFTALSA